MIIPNLGQNKETRRADDAPVGAISTHIPTPVPIPVNTNTQIVADASKYLRILPENLSIIKLMLICIPFFKPMLAPIKANHTIENLVNSSGQRKG